jgi:multiple antibiotic resistance protein
VQLGLNRRRAPQSKSWKVSLMIQTAKGILLVVSALFPIVDPIGGSPIFLSLTRDYTAQTRKVLARRIAVNSFILLVASFAIGSHVLSFFGISLPVVQVGGGLIVISTGWAMLNQKDGNDRGAVGRTVNCADALSDAFYPLTLPLTVGPGSISVAITLGANVPQHLGANLLAVLAAAIGSAFVAATIYLCYGFADRLAGVVGPTGMNVVIRLSSFLLVCIGVQIFWNGASKLLSSLPHVASFVVSSGLAGWL